MQSWYDALMLPTGAVGLVIGDVLGHDVGAVTTMAQLRTMVRAGRVARRPARSRADHARRAGVPGRHHRDRQPVLRPPPASRRGRLAGLLQRGAPAAVASPPGRHGVSLDGGDRLLLGTLGTGAPIVEGQHSEVAMPAGSILLLYTAGLIERHDVSLAEATQQLMQTLTSFDDTGALGAAVRAAAGRAGGA